MLLPSSLVRSSCQREPLCWNGVVVLGLCVYYYRFSWLLFCVCVCVCVCFWVCFQIHHKLCTPIVKGEKKETKSLCRDFISSGGEVKNGVKQRTKIPKKKSPTIHFHHHHRNINNNSTNHQQQSPPPPSSSSCWLLQQQLRLCSGIFGLFMMELHENKNDTQILIAKERLKKCCRQTQPHGMCVSK